MFLLLNFLLLVTIYLVYKFIIKPYIFIQFYKNQKFIPFFVPYFGNLKLLKQDLQSHSDMLYTAKTFSNKYENSPGTVINLRDEVILTIMDPKLKHEFFINAQNYIKRESSITFFLNLIFGKENIIFSEGDQWKKRRKIISKAFNFDYVKLFPLTVVPIASEVFSREYEDKYVDIMNIMTEITGRSFATSFFDEDISKLNYGDEKLLNVFTRVSMELGMQAYGWISFIFGGKRASKWLLTNKMKELNKKSIEIKNMMGDIIKRKYDQFQKGDLKEGNILYNMFKENQSGENKLEFDEIVNEFNMLLGAGTDTTAHLLAFALILLSKNPDKLEILNKEIEENINQLNDYNYDKLQQLSYLNAVLKETLRLNAPVPSLIQRKALNDHKLGNILIKKGTIVNISLINSSYSSKFYDEFDKFKPERWINNPINNLGDDNSFIYLPFSAGARNCIGQHVALIEAKCILAKFLKCFKFESEKEWKEKWVLKTLYEPQIPFKIKLIRK